MKAREAVGRKVWPPLRLGVGVYRFSPREPAMVEARGEGCAPAGLGLRDAGKQLWVFGAAGPGKKGA